MNRDDWIAICAHHLQRHWRTVDPLELDKVAGEIWQDERLRAKAPAAAAADWLQPIAQRASSMSGSDHERSKYAPSGP